MGFNLETFIEELLFILEKEQKAKKTIKELKEAIYRGKQYAKECGQI